MEQAQVVYVKKDEGGTYVMFNGFRYVQKECSGFLPGQMVICKRTGKFDKLVMVMWNNQTEIWRINGA